MKIRHIIIVILIFQSCSAIDYKGKLIRSPSGKYFIKANVNRSNNRGPDYATVIIQIYNTDTLKIDQLNTHAGDFNKWDIGWAQAGDTIILRSSDIGNKAWALSNQKWVELNIK
jgi:hypothetical protein